MPVRLPPYDEIRAALFAQWRRLVGTVDRLTPADLGRPTRISWPTAVLVAHVSQGALLVAQYLAAPPPGGRSISLADWATATSTVAAGVDARARAAVGRVPPLADTVDTVAAALAGQVPDRLVPGRFGPMRLADFLVTRAVEAVVHGLDLPEPLEPDPAAAGLVVRALAAVLVGRAPGRTVEVRVPPYVAIQCAAGPRHSRGTPPNIVETDPVMFMELATGRVSLADATSSGRLRASGARADLSMHLPLLG